MRSDKYKKHDNRITLLIRDRVDKAMDLAAKPIFWIDEREEKGESIWQSMQAISLKFLPRGECPLEITEVQNE